MGNNEEGKSVKPDKSSSPAPPDQTNIHVYPDWTAMQAYYGPRVALPPYYNSPMASGHAPHPYMWGPPQQMMPPYGAPYAAVYSHGGVYAHPAVPIGSQPPGHGVTSSSAALTPLNVEAPPKSAGNADRSLMKKLKGFDGLAMSIGNGHSNMESANSGERRLSQSSETEGSTDRSDGNTNVGRKRSREATPTIGREITTETPVNSLPSGEANESSGKGLPVGVAPDVGVSGKSIGSVTAPSMSAALELRNSPASAAKGNANAANVQPCAVVPSEAWLQNERELKRERRKQSNRESARRSRLRKQAETEELSQKVESLTSENMALKSEICQMSEKSEKLRLENAALLEKLKTTQLGHAKEIMLNGSDEPRATPVSTENLLSRVDNSDLVDRNTAEDGDPYERKSNSGAKLHQLLSTSPRADAVAAS